MGNFYDSLLELCESDIRGGEISKAAKRLSVLKPSAVPRVQRLAFANICRRVGKVVLGLKLLTLVVRPKTPLQTPATAAELAEYAVLLQRTGGVHEALLILNAIDPSVHPTTLLYMAFCYFNIWEYERALPLLVQYLEFDLTPNASLVGRLNLAAALVATSRFTEAQSQLEECKLAAQGMNHLRLLGNCHEMLAQIKIAHHDWTGAKMEVDRALTLLKDAPTMDQLFARKWQSFLSARESGSTAPLLELQIEARSRAHFETVRDCDLLLLSLAYDDSRFEHLYFGTPFTGYRDRITNQLGRAPVRQEFVLGRRGAIQLSLRGDKKIDLALRLLLRDFYRPMRLGSLFAGLFPGEHFDVYSSPTRVHQVLRRTRRHLEKLKVPVKLVGHNGEFRLVVEGDVTIVIPLEASLPSAFETYLPRLKAQFLVTDIFGAREIRELLGLSASGCRRFLSWAIDCGSINTFGAGPATTYSLNAKILRAA